jgi:uncharacterized protein
MGDLSKEPSMEEILSSIKRIIAEDGDADASATRGERRARLGRDPARKVPLADVVGDQDDAAEAEEEVLELTDSFDEGEDTDVLVDADESDYVAVVSAAAVPVPPASSSPLVQRKRFTPSAMPEPAPAPAAASIAAADTIVSAEIETAARSSLAALSSLLVKPVNENGDNTLEGLVREMLRPMLGQWLDANLPTLVEGMVAKEIARITGRTL